jgi:uncharacterized membrane protein
MLMTTARQVIALTTLVLIDVFPLDFMHMKLKHKTVSGKQKGGGGNFSVLIQWLLFGEIQP